MNTVKTLEEFKNLPLKTKVFLPGVSDIRWWFYAGVNPVADNIIMLVSSNSVRQIETICFSGQPYSTYYLKYEDACNVLLENAIKNVDTVKEIFFTEK